METQLLGPKDIAKAALLLKEGYLVAFPTETVYGLGAPIFNEKLVAQIFASKGRPADNPLIAHISDLSQILEIACEIPPFFDQLTKEFFPGPLTLILKRHPRVPAIVSGGLDTIAVRMPDHALAQALITAVGQPLVAPSANLSGRPSSTEASHVLHDFSGSIAAVIDGGPTKHGMESTVLSLLKEKPVLLRPGALSLADIEAVL
jgi:L-threonylcarbamoyladenylate synthase